MRYRAIFPLLLIVLVCAPSAQAYTSVPKHWHAPRPWLYQAWCLHDGVLRDTHGLHLYSVGSGEGAWNAATGNGYEGGLQFLLSTWLRAGGGVDSRGHWASVATPREQLYRAWRIFRSHRSAAHPYGSWSEWGDMRPACRLE